MDSVTPDVGGALQSVTSIFIGFGSDVFVFLVIAALVGAFAFYFGRDRLIPLVAGILAALPLYAYFPYMSVLGGNAYLVTGLFLLLAFLGMVAFTGLASFVPSSGVGFLKVIGLTVLTSALLVAIAINILPVHEIYTFSAPTLGLFKSSTYFWWLLAPVAGVFLLGK